MITGNPTIEEMNARLDRIARKHKQLDITADALRKMIADKDPIKKKSVKKTAKKSKSLK